MTTKKSIITHSVAFLLGAVIGAGVYGGIMHIPKTDVTGEQIACGDAGGLIMGESEGDGVVFTSYEIPAARYAEYAVPASAESAFTLTATITPEDAAIKTGKFSMAFANPGSEWATGKSCNTYISMQVNGLQATISCLEAFGEQIIVTFRSDDEQCTKTATCTLDYEKKLLSATYGFYFLKAGESTRPPQNLQSLATYPGDGGFAGTALYQPESGENRPMFYGVPDVVYSAYTVDKSITLKPTVKLNVSEDLMAAKSSFGTYLDNVQKDLAGSMISMNMIVLSMQMLVNLINYGDGYTINGSLFNSIISWQTQTKKHPFMLTVTDSALDIEQKFYFDIGIAVSKAVQNVELDSDSHMF